jgi:hypothetical protein
VRGQISIDLSGFPKLTLLRVTMRDVLLDKLLDAFLTVLPFNRLGKLVICVEFEFKGDYTALDSVLSQLLLAVEFQCIIPRYSPDLAKHFPQSGARDIVRLFPLLEVVNWSRDAIRIPARNVSHDQSLSCLCTRRTLLLHSWDPISNILPPIPQLTRDVVAPPNCIRPLRV